MKNRLKPCKFNTFNPPPRINKHLLSLFLLSLFVASFLASCTTDDATGSTDIGATLTLDDCPEDQLTLVEGVDNTFEWVNPTGADFTISSIVIAHTDSTVTDPLPELDAESTTATLPEGSYTVTITAASTDDASVTETCSFDVTVGPAVFTAICPVDVSIGIPIAGTAVTLADEASIMVTTANASGDATFSYEPESVMATAVGSSVSVTATATDADGATTSMCDFTVTVTQNMPSMTYTDTTFDCNPTPTMATFGLDGTGTTITLATFITSGITATNDGTNIDASSFVYNPDTISVAGEHSVRVTVEDDDGNLATNNNVEAECMFTFTVAATPTLTNCPTEPNSGITNSRVTWTPPTAANLPAEANLVVTVTSNGNEVTADTNGATFTTAGTYTVTFQVEDSSDAVLMVGSEELACASFDVVITAPAVMMPPTGSVFVLATNDQAPASNNPFLIQNAADLAMLATVVNTAASNAFTIHSTSGNYRTANYRLMATISLPELTGTDMTNFTPIGNSTGRSFNGTFDGNSNTISNLQYIGSSSSLGLFGVVGQAPTVMEDPNDDTMMITNDDGVPGFISNLTLMAPMITNSNTQTVTTGALVGTVLDSNSTISKVAVLEGTVVATGNTSGPSVGGLVGSNAGKIMNSAATTTVTGINFVGGLVGNLDTNGEIVASFASGAVTGTGRGAGEGISIGGLVGGTPTGVNAKIYNSYAAGAVSGDGDATSPVAGLIGQGPSITIHNSYARGKVTCTDSACTSGRGLKGGSFTSNISNSYWDTMTSMVEAMSSDNISNLGTGLTTAQLQLASATGIYSTWNDAITVTGGTDIPGNQWSFATGMYPGLVNNAVPLADQPRTAETQN